MARIGQMVQMHYRPVVKLPQGSATRSSSGS